MLAGGLVRRVAVPWLSAIREQCSEEERLWALAGYCVRSFPGAGKAQFEITYKYLFQARELGRTVRIGCYVSTVNSMDPEEWESTALANNIESGDGVVATLASTARLSPRLSTRSTSGIAGPVERSRSSICLRPRNRFLW